MQVSQLLQSLNVVVIHIRMKHYHSYMSRDVITWSLYWRVGIPTKIGGYHSIISQYLIILIKLIKATAPKFKLIKVTHSYRKRDLWKCYPYKWRVLNQNFFFFIFSIRVFFQGHHSFMEGTIFYSTLPLPSAHKHSDISLQLCTWDSCHICLIGTLVFTRLLLNETCPIIELLFD